jgi:hypothetical protein
VMAEVGQRTSDPIVSPTGVLLGYADDERFHSSPSFLALRAALATRAPRDRLLQ